MSKTLQLISKYYNLLGEQAPEGMPDLGLGAEGSPPQPDEPSEVSNLDNNEKHVIKILTNAFIFNPDLFKENKVKIKYIYNKIDEISRMVNVPVSKIVSEIKKIIALDKSLKIESKTITLINSYMILMEQPKDATEPQSDLKSSTKTNKLDDQENDLNLAEIFPLYKELILKALRHVPTEEELMIIKPVVNEFADLDPEKIVETIENILSQSLEDKEVEDNLSNA